MGCRVVPALSGLCAGGNSGIGAAIAAAAGAAGANVVIDYVARPEATDALDERSPTAAVRPLASTLTSAGWATSSDWSPPPSRPMAGWT